MAKIVTLKRQDGEIIFPVTSTKAVLDSEGVSMEKIFSKKSDAMEKVKVDHNDDNKAYIQAEMGDGALQAPVILPEALYNKDDYSGRNGLMSAADKEAVYLALMPGVTSMSGKKLADLRATLLQFITNAGEKNIAGAQLVTNLAASFVDKWNSEDTSNNLPTGGKCCFTMLGGNYSPNYVTLRIDTYYSDGSPRIYYLCRYAEDWGKIYQVATLNNTLASVAVIHASNKLVVNTKMGDGTANDPISIPEATYDATQAMANTSYKGSNGLMSENDKEALELGIKAYPVKLAGKTIADLRTALDSWLNRLAQKTVRSAVLTSDIGTAFINDWNSNNTTAQLIPYGLSCFRIISAYSDASYAIIEVSQYSSSKDKLHIYYINKYGNEWGPALQVSTANRAVLGLNIADDSQTGDVYLELEMGDGVSKIAGYLPTASTSGHGLMVKEDKAKLDSIDKIPDSFIDGLFSASVG